MCLTIFVEKLNIRIKNRFASQFKYDSLASTEIQSFSSFCTDMKLFSLFEFAVVAQFTSVNTGAKIENSICR